MLLSQLYCKYAAYVVAKYQDDCKMLLVPHPSEPVGALLAGIVVQPVDSVFDALV